MELVGHEDDETRSPTSFSSWVVHIENMENSLKEMKKAKKELEEQIHQQRLFELDDLIQEKGLSFDEIKTMLNKAE